MWYGTDFKRAVESSESDAHWNKGEGKIEESATRMVDTSPQGPSANEADVFSSFLPATKVASSPDEPGDSENNCIGDSAKQTNAQPAQYLQAKSRGMLYSWPAIRIFGIFRGYLALSCRRHCIAVCNVSRFTERVTSFHPYERARNVVDGGPWIDHGTSMESIHFCRTLMYIRG